ncbi:uncharacterized protein LOC111042501 [Myzus persicae]|uniref:uncharacterized protein LOC111042501 n=1 Tax=Myzus persicae TaxID=13164 RepID=UPI000B93576E|nr:uncharacterized protein LOC111042501 [Myzus persicae]
MNKLLNMASENDPAFCPNGCGHSYKGTERKSNLKRHLKQSCPKFQCTVCHKKYKKKASLLYHMMTIH